MSVLLVLEGAVGCYVCHCVSMSDEVRGKKGDRAEFKAKGQKETH